MKYIIVLIAFFSLFISCKNENNTQQIINANDSAIITVEVVDLDSGYGYNIYKDDRLFIHQTMIPAVNGGFMFSTPEDAQKAANYVAYIMSQKAGLPSVTIEELDSLGVLSDTILEYQKYDFTTTEGRVLHKN